jgi:peptidoglycan/LPS O-acetylase OafA/YrhL
VQVFNSVGGFGVGMFFVLSGFLLARPFWQALDEGKPLPSLKIYALRRAARILPGFWLALTVTFICSIFVFGFAADGWLWLRYAAGLLLVSK